MICLSRGCRASNLSVHPKNWNRSKSSIEVEWYISYRFYDPAYPKPKQVMIRGMNRYQLWADRKVATKALLANELENLTVNGYNPFTNTCRQVTELSPDTPIYEALAWAFEKITVADSTRSDLTYCLKRIKRPGYSLLAIHEVRRRHIKAILEETSKSADQFNKTRTYLMILFKELVERDVIDSNPVKDVSKRKSVKRIRRTLTAAERTMLNEYLKQYPSFYRFLQIFFHSGARIRELLRIQGKDVDLDRQVFRVIIKKGREYREVEKVIKDVALPYWKELKAGPEQYLFSTGLEPGDQLIRPDQVTKRWYRLVKLKKGIAADFYSLKHLNTDETSAALDLADAARHNSHTTPVITLRYAVGEKDRQMERIRKVDNKF